MYNFFQEVTSDGWMSFAGTIIGTLIGTLGAGVISVALYRKQERMKELNKLTRFIKDFRFLDVVIKSYINITKSIVQHNEFGYTDLTIQMIESNYQQAMKMLTGDYHDSSTVEINELLWDIINELSALHNKVSSFVSFKSKQTDVSKFKNSIFMHIEKVEGKHQELANRIEKYKKEMQHWPAVMLARLWLAD